MANGAVHRLNQWDYVGELEVQAARLGSGRSEALVIACADRAGGAACRWERAYPGALHLRTPGSEVVDAGVMKALQHAIGELKVREIICIAHTDCGRSPSVAPVGSSLMDRMREGARRHQEEVARGKERLREIVADADRAACFQARVIGVLEVGEGGPLLGYLPDEDAFVPI